MQKVVPIDQSGKTEGDFFWGGGQIVFLSRSAADSSLSPVTVLALLTLLTPRVRQEGTMATQTFH